MTAGQPIDEYKIAGDNARWYSNIRFAQLTLFLAVTAAIFNRAFNPSPLPDIIAALLKAGGIVAAVAFWYLEKRADDYWMHFMERAAALEKLLKFSQYTSRPRRPLRTTVVIRGFIALVGLFWLVALALQVLRVGQY